MDLPGGAGGACRATSLTIFANKNRFYIMFLSTKIHARIFFVFEWMLYVHVNLCIHTYIYIHIFTYIYIYVIDRMLDENTNAHKCTQMHTNAHVQGSQNHTRHTCSDRRTKQGIGRVGVRGGVTQDDVVLTCIFLNGKKNIKKRSSKLCREHVDLDGCKACLSGFPVWLSL